MAYLDQETITVSPKRTSVLCAFAALATAVVACSDSNVGSDELDDTEWIGANSFEVSTRFSSSIMHRAAGQYTDLATDAELQAEVIGTHISYAKTAMDRQQFKLNMLPDAILSTEVSVDGDMVTIHYEASVDMIRSKVHGVDVQAPEDLPKSRFQVKLPADPVGVYAAAGKECASNYGSYTLTEYKYFYYFDPTAPNCDIALVDGTIDVVAVYPNPKVYPEYDRLLNDLDDGRRGFHAAILPNYGDHDPKGRFDMHREALNRALAMEPEETPTYHRYNWTKDGATIVVDLYDPTKGSFTNTFHQALGEYQLVYYNGHSNYGHQAYLSNPDAYSDDYQILGMHSCQSYSYYAHQMATGKATASDPTGFVNSDMIATGRSSYPSDSPDVLVVLLDGLMSGLGAMVNDKPESAPSWQDIGDRMMAVAPSILYGIAGARNNAWQPGVGAEPTSACSHSYCETGDALAPSCDPCVAKVIAADDYCQQTHWDSYCVEAVESLCDVACE